MAAHAVLGGAGSLSFAPNHPLDIVMAAHASFNGAGSLTVNASVVAPSVVHSGAATFSAAGSLWFAPNEPDVLMAASAVFGGAGGLTQADFSADILLAERLAAAGATALLRRIACCGACDIPGCCRPNRWRPDRRVLTWLKGSPPCGGFLPQESVRRPASRNSCGESALDADASVVTGGIVQHGFSRRWHALPHSPPWHSNCASRRPRSASLSLAATAFARSPAGTALAPACALAANASVIRQAEHLLVVLQNIRLRKPSRLAAAPQVGRCRLRRLRAPPVKALVGLVDSEAAILLLLRIPMYRLTARLLRKLAPTSLFWMPMVTARLSHSGAPQARQALASTSRTPLRPARCLMRVARCGR